MANLNDSNWDGYPNTREEARILGATHYFDGVPCAKNGHVALRYTRTGGCVQCSREAGRRRYAANPTATRERVTGWRGKNPGASRRWAEANPTATRVHTVRSGVKTRRFPEPPYLTAEERQELDRISAERPDGMAIDHIVALGHPLLVGLHVPQNLQYLTPGANSKKGTKLPEGITPEIAVARGMAIWRRDVNEDGTVNWQPYWPKRSAP